MPLLYWLLFGLFSITSVHVMATETCGEDCVPVNEWQVNLALGLGARENPLVDGKHTPLILMPEVTWYGKRFFINNLELGATLYENKRHQLNAIVTPGYQQMHFNRWDPFNFFDSSSGGGNMGAPLNMPAIAQTYNVSITYTDTKEGLPPSTGVAADSANGSYTQYEASGVSAVMINGELIDLTTPASARPGASSNTVELALQNGNLQISGLSSQDRVELIGDAQAPEASSGGSAGRATDFSNITYVPQSESASASGSTVMPVSSRQVRQRRMAGLTGIEYLYSMRRLQLHAQLLADFTGVHDGYEVRLATIFPWQLGDNRYALTLGTNYQSRRVLDYYYGVRPDDNVSAGQLFAADAAGSSHMLRLDWQKPISPRWSLRGLIKYSTLAPEIRSSPLVDKNYSGAIFIGGVYHF